ncbi:uncharacterized protein LOC134260185 [Saccostrea cucullata]|uniref:uncharacterized protein LOC134260185 n=1 Tax=Saccostrea cuccullata TaxID=36930 RepID=UPI002ECFD956
MDKEYLKKKAWYLGEWRQSVLADTVINQIHQLVKGKKGKNVKLCMARDGIRVFVSNLLQGKILYDHVPFTDLYFMTVNQHNPSCLLVIAKDPRHKYRILAYRCENSLDAGLFIQYYRDVRKSMTSVEGYNIELRRSDEGNWTLRSKQHEDNKRQLKTIVNMQTGTAQPNGGIQNSHTKVAIVNGQSKPDENRNTQMVIQTRVEKSPPSSPREKVILEKVYRKGKSQNNIGIQASGPGTERYSDNVSETSDSNQSFQNELNYLSNELREIKFMLEKSTGISAEVFHDKSGKEIQTESFRTEPDTELTVNKALEPIDAVVRDEEEEEVKLREVQNDDGPKVRVSVPDYRSLGVQASSKTLPPPPEKRAATLPATFRQTQPDGPELLRASTTNYQSWKDDVMLRGRVGRSTRPRTTLYSTSSYTSTDGSIKGSLRGAPNGVHVHFDSAAPKGSVVYRKKAISTNVQKPIERVYQRPHSVHSTGRPYVVHHHHHHRGPVYQAAVPATLDLNQNKVNDAVITNGHSPSSPRSSNGAGFFIRT